MKPDLKRGLGLLVALACTFSSVNAKIWRVNNTPGVNADFASLSAAFTSALVLEGDTIYVEPTATAHGNATLRKRLVVMGGGYLLDEYPGLQYGNSGSRVGTITLDSTASGTKLIGLEGAVIFVNSDVDNVTVERVDGRILQNNSRPNSKMENWVIKQCRLGGISFPNAAYHLENPVIINNIITAATTMASVTNGLIRNNLFLSQASLKNSYVANNIFAYTSSYSFENCTVRYNIAVGNTLPSGNNNQVNIPTNVLFVGTGAAYTQYRLAPGSPAIGAGEPINGETPDIGPFGTQDPYRICGLPPIPIFTELSVPATIPASATSMEIVISVRSNN